MNVAYSEELRPPYDMFSRDWDIHGSHGRVANLMKYESRIDSLLDKLWSIESSIKHRSSDLLGMNDVDVIGEIEYVERTIGIWSITESIPNWQKPGWIRVMMYPHSGIVNEEKTIIDSSWNEHIFGKEKKEGTCIVMLSDEAVQWLNKVSHWVSDMSTDGI